MEYNAASVHCLVDEALVDFTGGFVVGICLGELRFPRAHARKRPDGFDVNSIALVDETDDVIVIHLC